VSAPHANLHVEGNVYVSSNLTVSGNVVAGYLYGDGSNISGISSNLDQIVNNGNVTSNTVQFSNAITGFVTTANIEVGTANLFVDTSSSRVGIGTNAPGAKLHIGAFDNNHLLLTSVNNDYGWKIDTEDQGNGEVPFRLYRRTNTVDTLALSVANQNSRVNHTHTEKYNFHYNAATWGLYTNVDSTATNLLDTTINFPYDGYIFVKGQGHWARYDTAFAGVGGNQSFYAWISLNNQESAWSGQYNNHTGTDTNSYDKFHSYQSPDTNGAGSWRNFHYSNFYKVSAGNNTLSLRVNNYFGSGHYLAINGAGISGFYMPKNYL
jgi:hypothetical protein